MSMNPWLAKQLVTGRIDDLELAALARRPADDTTDDDVPTSAPHPHGALALHVGGLFIAMGRRLAGPEALRAALDRSRLGPKSSPA
jgi:hypothetical protein